jgi:hypothetical protein
MAEKIALYYLPANEGDFVAGIPARDLTEAEVAELATREPAALLTATTPHPTTGQALYQQAKPGSREAGGGKRDKGPAAAPEEGADR